MLPNNILTGYIESWTSLGIGRSVSLSHADMNIRILHLIDLTVGLFNTLSSRALVERPTVSAKCFIVSMLRGSEPGNLLSYLWPVSCIPGGSAALGN